MSEEEVKKIWHMLDSLAEADPQEYKKFIDQQLKEGAQMLAKPEPSFCIRVPVKGKASRHLFINVCKWTRVPGPGSDEDPIPVKGGTLRNVTRAREGARERKKLSDNLLVDIAFDPSVVEECLKDAVMERMLIELSLNFVEEYCDMLLNKPRWVKLEGEAFLGPESDLHCSLDEQWRELLSKASKLDVGDSILRELKAGDRKAKTSEKQDKLPPLRLSAKRKADKKLVEEVGIRQGKKTERKDTTTATSRSTSTGASSSDNHREQEERPVQVPDHWIVLKEASVKYPKRVVVKVALTEVKSVSEVELQVSKHDLEVTAGDRYHLKVTFPSPVDDGACKSAFNPKTSLLTVSTPCEA